MDTHYHLVLQFARDISSEMRVLNGAHSRAFNARHGTAGAERSSRRGISSGPFAVRDLLAVPQRCLTLLVSDTRSAAFGSLRPRL
jgi:hypothetical protein